MQKKLFRKIVAGALSVAMVLGMTAVSFADTVTTGGTPYEGSGAGTLEGYVDDEVISVDLPTSATNVFDYKMDPQKLIQQTDAAAHSTSGKTFEDGATVYFQDKDGNWGSKSQLLTVKNTGTVDIDLTMKARLSAAPTKYAMADNMSDWETSTAAEMYLGLFIDGSDDDTTAITGTSDITLVKGLQGNKDNYHVTTSGSSYVFKAKDGETDWANVSFGLTGACNTNEGVDWSDLKGANAEDDVVDVTVTWSFAKRESGSGAELIEVANGPTGTLTSAGLVTFSDIAGENNVVDITTIKIVYTSDTGTGELTYGANPEFFTNLKTEGTWTADGGGSFTIELSADALYALENSANAKAKVMVQLKDRTWIETNEVAF